MVNVVKKCIWSAVPNEGEFVLHLNLTTFLSAKYDINYYLACWYLILKVVLNLLFSFAQPQSDLVFTNRPITCFSNFLTILLDLTKSSEHQKTR